MTPRGGGRVRIAIVDDHPMVRRGMISMLEDEADFELVGEAATASEALDLLESDPPDLAIVDISLPGMNGIELIKRLHGRWPELKILVTSMHDERVFAERALRAGAVGYIEKRQAIRELVRAIRQVNDGQVYLSEDMTERVLQRLTGRAREKEKRLSIAEKLTDREIEIFLLIGEGITTQEIAERLGISVKTVESHRENIKQKVGAENINELIRLAVEWRVGQE